jgi:hypothetical protein
MNCRGQGEHQDGRFFAFEEKRREGHDLHRDEQGEGRQPIGAAADPALEAEKDLLQFHRILGRRVLSGALIGSVWRQIWFETEFVQAADSGSNYGIAVTFNSWDHRAIAPFR